MKHSVTVTLISLTIAVGCAFGQAEKKLKRPKLVVGFVIDQMRWDYLYRYYERYGDAGFKTFLNEGFTYENTFINHIPSVTGVGHATIFTGTIPAVHGINSNMLTFNESGRKQNVVGDDNVEPVGTKSSAGKMSPHNMRADTIGDQLRLATNFRAKVIGISPKDRAAILPAGHSATAAYWLDKVSGDWISSTYYLKKLPDWVQDFNSAGHVKEYLSKNWETLYDIDTYIQSSEDDVPWERKFKGAKSPTFPVELPKLHSDKNMSVIYNTPFGNTLTFDFAKVAIEQEKLGQRGETDMLTINIPGTDSIGHQFGPNSVEIEDTYLRLDKDFEDFFQYLDKHIGKGEYLVFLSADHGGNHNAQFLEKNKMKMNTASSKDIALELNNLLKKEFGVDELITEITYDMFVNYNYPLIREKNIDEEKLTAICMESLRKNSKVAHVMDMQHPGEASIPEFIKTKMINGYSKDRGSRIQFIFYPNAGSLRQMGTTHRDWNPYDAKIPNIWYGWGVKKGKSFRTVYMEDIAPTVTSLLRIMQPNGTTGHALPEVIDTNAF